MRCVLLLLLFSPLTLAAQFSLASGVGYASFEMGDMKILQRELQKSFPVKAQITSSFPAFWFYELSGMQTNYSDFVVGGSVSFTSTGGRLYYSDYSGMIGSDQLLTSLTVSGIFGKTIRTKNKRFSVTGDVRPGVMGTNLELTTTEEISGPRRTTSNSFHSLNFTFQPTVTLTGKVGRFGLNMVAGYQAAIAGKLHHKGDREAYLTSGSEGYEVKADWSGIRASIGISFDFAGL